MKKKNQVWHKIVGFVGRELEMTLAVLIVFTFIFGYSFAADSETLDSGDAEVVIEYTNKLKISGSEYDGLNFTATNLSGLYRVRMGYDRGDISTTTEGTKGMSRGAQYTYTLNLSQPVKSSFYLHGSYAHPVSINGVSVTAPTNVVSITGPTITILFEGGDLISKLVAYPGSVTDKVVDAEVSELYLIPNLANVEVDMSRYFEVVALNPEGQSVQANVRWSVTAGKNFATINASTGELTGIAVGGPVTIKASINGTKTATATVTVKASSASTLQAIIDRLSTTTGEQTSYPGADEEVPETYPGADEDDEPLFEGSPGDFGYIPPAASAEINEAVLDQLAEEKAVAIEENQSPYLNEAAVQKVLNETQTTTQRVMTKFSMNVGQVFSDLGEIFIGRTVQTANGETHQIQNVWKRIGGLIANLFGFGGSTGEIGGAAPLRLETGEGDAD